MKTNNQQNKFIGLGLKGIDLLHLFSIGHCYPSGHKLSLW